MNVLPRHATFQSFFAVTAVIVVITAILIFFVRDIILAAKMLPQQLASLFCFLRHYQYISQWRAFDTRMYYGYANLLTEYDNWLDGFERYQFRFVYPQRILLNFLRKLQRPLVPFGSETHFSFRLFCVDILSILMFPFVFALAIVSWILWSIWTLLGFLWTWIKWLYRNIRGISLCHRS